MLNRNEFDAFVEERTISGQRQLASAMRQLVGRSSPQLGQALADAPDQVFLEPLLFTYFAEPTPGLGLPQILLGALPAHGRPDGIEVHADAQGRVYLPGQGYLLVDAPDTPLILGRAGVGKESQPALRRGAVTLEARFQPLEQLAGTDIELLAHDNPLVGTRFKDVQGRPVRAVIEGQGRRHREHLRATLALLGEHCPPYQRLVSQVTRQLVVFQAHDVNSFASINLHGAALFNPPPDCDEVYFFDEIVHQCGHVVWNAATVRRREFLAMDPERPLQEIAPREVGRTLYDAFHGLYTEYMMTRCLRHLDERGVLQGRQAHELFGRLSFITRKFRVDVRNLAVPGVFAPLGHELYQYFACACAELSQARPDLLETDMRGQGYNFDYPLFARSNPARSISRWAVGA